MTYAEWLLEQTPERQVAALGLRDLCKRLGEVKRSAPHAPETQAMEQEVRDYYKKWEAPNDTQDQR